MLRLDEPPVVGQCLGFWTPFSTGVHVTHTRACQEIKMGERIPATSVPANTALMGLLSTYHGGQGGA